MHDPASELPRIPIPRTPVNKLTMPSGDPLTKVNRLERSVVWGMPVRPSVCYVEAYAAPRRRGRRASVSDAADAPLFPPEEICSQAQGNAAAWILTIIAYLKERGEAVEDCVAYHGRSFAPAWEWLRGRPVEEVAQQVALNALSVGASIRSLSSENGRAEALVEGWPDEELMSFLPLDRDDCDQI